MNLRSSYFISLVASAMILTLSMGCSGVKNCVPPALNLPEELAGNSIDSTTIADLAWWEIYTDSALVAIINETLVNNRDLLAAGAKVEQMRELYGLSKANFFPTVGGNVYGNYETNDYKDEKKVRDPEYGLKATISWETDLWGGLKWARRKGDADFMASIENRRAMMMTLIAETASTYFQLIALDNELSIVRQTLATREENVRMAKLRFEGGLTPETVYQQAQVEYATTAALVPNLERQIEMAKSALTLLMGRYPEKELARGRLSLERAIPDYLPVGLPSTLLQRRPDLRMSEQQLRSALAGVGVAYANRFPNFRIALTGGWENNSLKGFFSSPFSYTIGQITGTILDFGRNKRKYRAAIAAYDQARYAYEQDVLEAFKEVSDAVETFQRRRQTTSLRRDLREAAGKYVELANLQYRSGILAYIDVLDAQRRFFEAQIGLSNAVRDEYLALVNLYKVLGGGWNQ